jgi:methionine aminopeptidase
VTDAIAKGCAPYKVEPLEGVLSHKQKKHLIDGNEVIINKLTPEQCVEPFELAAGDVIGLDIFVSTGEGKPKESEIRTTVHKRELEMHYNLKSNKSRSFFSEFNARYPTFPFSIAGFEDAVGAKVGVRECTNHDLIVGYPVLTEKPGEFVAQFKCTVTVQPRSTAVLAGDLPLDFSQFETENKIEDEELKALLARPLWVKEKKAAKPVAEPVTE